LSGLRPKVKSAHLVKGGTEIKFTQDDFQTKLIGLPGKAPDSAVTTIAIECESEPVQDTNYVRINKPRASVIIATVPLVNAVPQRSRTRLPPSARETQIMILEDDLPSSGVK